MNLRTRLAAADPLRGTLPRELAPPPLPAGEVGSIAYTGARRHVAPRRLAALALAAGATAAAGFGIAGLTGHESSGAPAGQPAGSPPPATAEPATTATPTVATAVAAEPEGVRDETLGDVVYPVPREWSTTRAGDSSTAYRAADCNALIAVETHTLRSQLTAAQQISKMIVDGPVLATTSGGRMAFRLVRDDARDSLAGGAVLPRGGDRWSSVVVHATGDCPTPELARRLREPLTNVLAYLRPR
jgi:hypothetical protein